MRFFFYGTLLDPEVRALVLAPCVEDLALAPATLTGWTRGPARHGSFPVIRKRLGGRVDGLVAEGIDRAGLWRMAHFEGDGYTIGRVTVWREQGPQPALAFLPERSELCLPGRWSLADWQRRHKRRFLPRVRRWMNEFGATGPWSADLTWHSRRRLAAVAAEAAAEVPAASFRLAA